MARSVVVETGLSDEVEYRGKSFTRHARTRFVKPAKVVEVEPPKLGDPWEPLTVRARLHRMNEVFRRIPHTPDTKPRQHRSSMPEPVREVFKDQPGEPMRLPVGRADHSAAMQLLDSLVKRQSRLQRVLIWGIAAKQSHRQLAKHLCCGHPHAGRRVQEMLVVLAADWNARGWRPDATDIADALDLIHRKIK
jgi:hypothetical protein